MDKHSMEKEIKQVVSYYLHVPVDALQPDAIFTDDLGADSLATIEIIMALEKKYGIEITDEDSRSFYSINSAVDLIRKKH